MRASPWFVLITAVFITCLIAANVVAVKLVAIGAWLVPAGIVIFPLSYLLGDVLTEVYGFRQARLVIWLGFGCNALFVAALWLAGLLPAASGWDGQAAYARILGFTPRLLGASFAAYLVGEFANAFVLARMKVLTQGRWLWSRTIGSTVVGQALDSLIFITLAFAGLLPPAALLAAVLTQWLLKSGYEIIATPLTYLVVGFLKRTEGLDPFDYHLAVRPLPSGND
ncbi:MAG: queuosine precursor transporter [Thermomicrobiales bacterium]